MLFISTTTGDVLALQAVDGALRFRLRTLTPLAAPVVICAVGRLCVASSAPNGSLHVIFDTPPSHSPTPSPATSWIPPDVVDTRHTNGPVLSGGAIAGVVVGIAVCTCLSVLACHGNSLGRQPINAAEFVSLGALRGPVKAKEPVPHAAAPPGQGQGQGDPALGQGQGQGAQLVPAPQAPPSPAKSSSKLPRPGSAVPSRRDASGGGGAKSRPGSGKAGSRSQGPGSGPGSGAVVKPVRGGAVALPSRVARPSLTLAAKGPPGKGAGKSKAGAVAQSLTPALATSKPIGPLRRLGSVVFNFPASMASHKRPKGASRPASGGAGGEAGVGGVQGGGAWALGQLPAQPMLLDADGPAALDAPAVAGHPHLDARGSPGTVGGVGSVDGRGSVDTGSVDSSGVPRPAGGGGGGPVRRMLVRFGSVHGSFRLWQQARADKRAQSSNLAPSSTSRLAHVVVEGGEGVAQAGPATPAAPTARSTTTGRSDVSSSGGPPLTDRQLLVATLAVMRGAGDAIPPGGVGLSPPPVTPPFTARHAMPHQGQGDGDGDDFVEGGGAQPNTPSGAPTATATPRPTSSRPQSSRRKRPVRRPGGGNPRRERDEEGGGARKPRSSGGDDDGDRDATERTPLPPSPGPTTGRGASSGTTSRPVSAAPQRSSRQGQASSRGHSPGPTARGRRSPSTGRSPAPSAPGSPVQSPASLKHEARVLSVKANEAAYWDRLEDRVPGARDALLGRQTSGGRGGGSGSSDEDDSPKRKARRSLQFTGWDNGQQWAHVPCRLLPIQLL